jgi:hypothetical protein
MPFMPGERTTARCDQPTHFLCERDTRHRGPRHIPTAENAPQLRPAHTWRLSAPEQSQLLSVEHPLEQRPGLRGRH